MARLVDIDLKDKADVELSMSVLYAVSLSYDESEPIFCLYKDLKDMKIQFEDLLSKYDKLDEEHKVLLGIEDERKRAAISFDEEKNTFLTEIEHLKAEMARIELENNKLREKLSNYTIGYSSVSNDKPLFFSVINGKLDQTTSSNATFIAIETDKGYEFEINEEKVQHSKVIALRNKEIEPFCDIVNEDVNPNYIKRAGKGLFIIKNDIFELKDKAKVVLIRR